MNKLEKVVVIDAGHGGKDPGASGHHCLEKDITLDYSKVVASKLLDQGVYVITTRDIDEYVHLVKRAEIGRENNADAFVSIHANAFVNKDVKGIETYYLEGNNGGKLLAEKVHNSILKSGDHTVDRGLKTANFRVLRNSGKASILLELGFITNKEDFNILMNKQDTITTAIVVGIMEYLGLEYKEPKKEKSTLDLVVDGKNKEVEGFIVDGVSYLSIRDYGEKAGMNIGWDKVKRKILVDTKISDIDIEIDGEKNEVRGINIDRENYVRIRDIVKLLNHEIEWDKDRRMIVINTELGGV